MTLISGTTVKALAVTTLISASGLGLAAPVLAAPTAQASAQATIAELEADGYRVILNKVGNASMDKCSVSAVRPGTSVKHSWIQRGPAGNVNPLVRYKTVYVDLMCKR